MMDLIMSIFFTVGTVTLIYFKHGFRQTYRHYPDNHRLIMLLCYVDVMLMVFAFASMIMWMTFILNPSLQNQINMWSNQHTTLLLVLAIGCVLIDLIPTAMRIHRAK